MPALGAEDLAQQGRIAVIGVCERFDARKGVPFAAFLQTRLKGSMRDALRVEARQSKRDKLARCSSRTDPDDPTAFSPADPVEQLPDKGPGADHHGMRNDARRMAAIAIDSLEGREREIIVGLFVHGKSQREVGEQLDLSPGRICQIQMAALAKMRVALKRYGISATRNIL